MSPKKIIVIEDDRSFARLLEVLLVSRGFEVNLCIDPRNAAAMAKHIEPDLIMLNVHMHRRSGISVLRKLRQQTCTSITPVIICSNMSSSKAMEQLEKLGVKDFIPKTSEPGVLLEKIMSYLAVE
jgi:two-component system copper resistance phosphate regulon response regulator CusR